MVCFCSAAATLQARRDRESLQDCTSEHSNLCAGIGSQFKSLISKELRKSVSLRCKGKTANLAEGEARADKKCQGRSLGLGNALCSVAARRPLRIGLKRRRGSPSLVIP